MSITNKFFAAAIATTVAASGAYAKGHDQSQGADGTPGANTGAETVGAAQTLGAALGNGQDKSGKERGNSANAGRPGGGDNND